MCLSTKKKKKKKEPPAVLCFSDLESAGRECYCCENESDEVSVRGGGCGSQHSGSGECVFANEAQIQKGKRVKTCPWDKLMRNVTLFIRRA